MLYVPYLTTCQTTYAFPVKIVGGASCNLTQEIEVQALYNDTCNYNYVSARFAEIHLGMKKSDGDASEAQLEGDCTLIWQCSGLSRYKQRTVFWIVPDAKFDLIFGHDDEDFNPRFKTNRDQFRQGVRSGFLKKGPAPAGKRSFQGAFAGFDQYFRRTNAVEPPKTADSSSANDIALKPCPVFTLAEIQEQIAEQLACSEERKHKHELRRAVNIWNPHVPASLLFRKDSVTDNKIGPTQELPADESAENAPTASEDIATPARETEHVENVTKQDAKVATVAVSGPSTANQSVKSLKPHDASEPVAVVPTDVLVSSPEVPPQTESLVTVANSEDKAVLSSEVPALTVDDFPQVPSTNIEDAVNSSSRDSYATEHATPSPIGVEAEAEAIPNSIPYSIEATDNNNSSSSNGIIPTAAKQSPPLPAFKPAHLAYFSPRGTGALSTPIPDRDLIMSPSFPQQSTDLSLSIPLPMTLPFPDRRKSDVSSTGAVVEIAEPEAEPEGEIAEPVAEPEGEIIAVFDHNQEEQDEEDEDEDEELHRQIYREIYRAVLEDYMRYVEAKEQAKKSSIPTNENSIPTDKITIPTDQNSIPVEKKSSIPVPTDKKKKWWSMRNGQ
jgi:hypothetical protein